MERSFPTRRLRSFLSIRIWVVGMDRRLSSSWSLLSGRATVPALVSKIHPKTPFTQAQSPFWSKSFLTDTDHLSFLGR